MQSEDQSALAAIIPQLTADMGRINALLEAGCRTQAIAQFHGLASLAVETQRPGLTCQGYLLPGRTAEISVCRIPAQPRPGKPIALVLPGLLSFLPLAVARFLPFIDLFDIVLCELPGHGASEQQDDVSLQAFAEEYAGLVATALPRASSLFVIGESLGGLVALGLAHLLPRQVRDVVLLDPPFHLTRPNLAAWICESWRYSGSRPYIRRICREIMGFDPADGSMERTTRQHDLVRGAGFNGLLIAGGDLCISGAASAVSADDIDALRAANPHLRVAPRVPASGHAVLLDNPRGTRAVLEACLTSAKPGTDGGFQLGREMPRDGG